MNVLDELEAVLRERAETWSSEDRNLARVAAADLVDLLARQAAGKDVTAELAIARATAQQIAAGAAVTGARLLGEWIERVGGVGLRFLLAAEAT